MPAARAGPAVAIKLPALTSIRAVAAWWVVLFHTREHLVPYLPRNVVGVLGSGYVGVDLFFILSGFVIHLNYGDRLVGGGRSAYIDFLKRRFARIYPLHFAILCAAVAYAALIYVHSGRLTANYNFAYLPAHFLLIQAWGIDPLLRWNDPAWSISTEALAYLLFPLIAVVARPARWPLPAQIAAIGALLLALWLGLRLLGISEIGSAVMRGGLWRCLTEFSIGAVLCAIYRQYATTVVRGVPPLLLAAATLIAGAGLALRASDIVFVPAAFAFLVLGLAFANARGRTLLDMPVLIYLGDISYSTYLSHFMLLVLVKNFQRPGHLIPLVQLVGYFGAVALASVLLYKFLEIPAQRRLLDRMGLRTPKLVPVGAP
jgi:peptidoglycan/LPS O-acetylase OafA/YrhL